MKYLQNDIDKLLSNRNILQKREKQNKQTHFIVSIAPMCRRRVINSEGIQDDMIVFISDS